MPPAEFPPPRVWWSPSERVLHCEHRPTVGVVSMPMPLLRLPADAYPLVSVEFSPPVSGRYRLDWVADEQGPVTITVPGTLAPAPEPVSELEALADKWSEESAKLRRLAAASALYATSILLLKRAESYDTCSAELRAALIRGARR